MGRPAPLGNNVYVGDGTMSVEDLAEKIEEHDQTTVFLGGGDTLAIQYEGGNNEAIFEEIHDAGWHVVSMGVFETTWVWITPAE